MARQDEKPVELEGWECKGEDPVVDGDTGSEEDMENQDQPRWVNRG